MRYKIEKGRQQSGLIYRRNTPADNIHNKHKREKIIIVIQYLHMCLVMM